MNHKSIMRLLAASFSFAIFISLISFSASHYFCPELFFTIFFAVMVIVSIIFFQRDARLNASNKKAGLVKVINQKLYIGRHPYIRKRSSLFLRVSIITLLGFFKKK